MTADLFSEPREILGDGAVLLRGFALDDAEAILARVREIAAAAPFRHLVTPGGFTMSVAMTNCGTVGWVSDRTGYRYDPCDPESGTPWPAMPALFAEIAGRAAAEAGYPGYVPESCLINRYEPGSRLTLHQDRDEGNYSKPIVSVALGLPATFLFGGPKRTDKQRRVPLFHGDVAVWGGVSRLNFHGIAPLAKGTHPATGECRINLTFRKAL